MIIMEAGNYAFFSFQWMNSVAALTGLEFYIEAMYLRHLANDGHLANVNFMKEPITLTLSDDMCDLW